MSFSYANTKNFLIRVLALFLFVVLLPITLFVVLLLCISLRGNPFFIQQRPGKFGKPFNIIKFKTMLDTRDENGDLLPDIERITHIGSIIRKLSLDELPQLINVVKGEMTLIGPRPLLMQYLPLYNEQQMRRHDVLPGITGWAQVNGRNALSWDEKFKLDLFYVDNQSFTLDLKILWLTVQNVIFAKDVNASERVTMRPFNGNN